MDLLIKLTIVADESAVCPHPAKFLSEYSIPRTIA
jgi:hypothetical protein